MSERNYTVQTRIERTVGDVFDAIVNEVSICKYFTESTSGPLSEGQQVTWTWSQWGDFPVRVKRIIENELIHLEIDSGEWKKTTPDEASYPVAIQLELESLDGGATMLSISEQGWQNDASGLRGSHDKCSGWTHMAMCLKAYLEHGIDMR